MANRGGFSWKRLTGISAAKSRISRATGVPLTRSGRERKIGRMVTGGGCALVLPLLLAVSLALSLALVSGCAASSSSPTSSDSVSAPAPVQPAPPAPVQPAPPATDQQSQPAVEQQSQPAVEQQSQPVEPQPAAPVLKSPASTKTSDVTVYITETGEKYHVGSCRYLSHSKIPIGLSDAQSQGYAPCKVCSPPQ